MFTLINVYKIFYNVKIFLMIKMSFSAVSGNYKVTMLEISHLTKQLQEFVLYERTL